jgi:hypothetical protein
MTNLWMSSLKSNFSPLKALAFAFGVLSLSGCQELGSETASAPLRPVDVTRSTVTVSNATNAEVTVGQTATVRLADKRGAGIMNLQPKITLVKCDGSAATGVSAGTCSVTASGGTSTCLVSASIAGTYCVKVLEPAAFLTSSQVTFVQKLASLEFSAQPSSAAGWVVDTSIVAKVRVLDRAGTPITSGTAATAPIDVELVTPAGASLIKPSPVLNAVAGEVTFTNLRVDKTGTYTLRASSGSAVGVSAAFTTKAAAPIKLKFTRQPSPVTASQVAFAQQPAVGLYDLYDNPVTTFNCTITLTREASSPAGTLIGASTKTTVGGIADFATNALRFNTVTAGTTYKLHAKAAGVSPCGTLLEADTDPFEITLSGVPWQLAVSQPPSTAAMSQVFPIQPEIQVLDIDGNPVTNDNASVVVITKRSSSPGGSTDAPLVGSSSIRVTNGVAKFAGLYINSTNPSHEGDYTYDITGTAPGIGLLPTSVTHLVTADGNRPGFTMEFMDRPDPVTLQQTLPAIRVRKLDSRGYLNFTDNTTDVTIALSAGVTGTLAGTLTRTMANGVATFDDLKITGATGMKTLTATVASGAGITPTSITSTQFAVSAFGTPSQLRFIGSINDQGSKGDSPWVSAPEVWVQDASNNLVSNDSSTVVTISIFQRTGGSDVLMGTTQKTVSGGKATFTDVHSQDYNLTNVVLQATAPGLNSGQSVTFNGNTSQPARLRWVAQPVWAQKTGTAAGKCFVSSSTGSTVPVAVEIVDTANNRVTGENTWKVTLSCASCGVSGPTELQFTNGLATFTGLIVNESQTGAKLTAQITTPSTSGISALDSSAFNTPACPSP